MLCSLKSAVGPLRVLRAAVPISFFFGLSLSAVRQRDEWERKRKMKVKRERGWTGRSWGGISLGPPDPGPNGGKMMTAVMEKEEVKQKRNNSGKGCEVLDNFW